MEINYFLSVNIREATTISQQVGQKEVANGGDCSKCLCSPVGGVKKSLDLRQQ